MGLVRIMMGCGMNEGYIGKGLEKNGVYRKIYEDGISEIEFYKEGKLDGCTILIDADGKVDFSKSITYKNGTPLGKLEDTETCYKIA